MHARGLARALEGLLGDGVGALAALLEDVEHECVAAYYLLQHCSNGYDCARDVINAVEDVQLFKGSGAEYAEEFATDCCDMRNTPNFIRYHIDWEGVARDMDINGDICTFRFNGDDWVCTNASEI